MRDVLITYSTSNGMYTISLRVSQEIHATRHVTNYHELNGIVSNWLHHGEK